MTDVATEGPPIIVQVEHIDTPRDPGERAAPCRCNRRVKVIFFVGACFAHLPAPLELAVVLMHPKRKGSGDQAVTPADTPYSNRPR